MADSLRDPKRSLAALALLTGLGCVCAVLILTAPPSGSTSPSTPHVQALGALTSIPTARHYERAQILDAGAGPSVTLRYAWPRGHTQSLEMELVQTMVLTGSELDTRVVTEIRSRVVIERGEDATPEGQQFPAYISFEAFTLEVTADGERVEVPAIDSLLRGLRIEVQVDPVQGLQADDTLSSVNPQVKRMLSLLVDVLRRAHPVLTEQPIAREARWSVEGSWSSDIEGSTLATALTDTQSVTELNADAASLSSKSVLSMTGSPAGHDAVEGSGSGEVTVTVTPNTGELQKGLGTLSYAQRLGAGETGLEQRFTMEFRLGRAENQQ